jgi:hypothetical protein
MSGEGQQYKTAGLTEADQKINETTEDISNQASGHKANLSNPSKLLKSDLLVMAC